MPENCTALTGKPYTGKTARMLYEVRSEERVLLLDPKCAQLFELPGWGHFLVGYDPETDKLLDAAPLVELMRTDSFRAVVHLKSYHREAFELLCCLAMGKKGLTLAADELMLFVPAGPLGMLGRYATEVIVSGSHQGVRFIGTTQAFSVVHVTARRVIQRLLVFRTDDRSDVDLLSNYLPADFVEELPKLPDQVCVDWADWRAPFVDRALVGKLGDLLPKERFVRSVS